MNLRYSFKTAIVGLKTNKVRSFLTILGIVIGITAIILISSLGQGAQNLILGQIQGLGTKTIVVIPGREPSGPSDSAQIFSDSLKERDLIALQKKGNVPTLSNIMPLLFGGESSSRGNETFRLTIYGASPIMQRIFDVVPSEGIFFTDDDVRSMSSVVVIGSKVKTELFNNENAIGEKIKIKNRNYKVIGVLPKKGQVSFFNFDEAVIMPYTSAGQYIFGIKYFHRLVIEATSEDTIDVTVGYVESVLRANHNITDPDKDDFFVQTQADLAKTVGVVTTALTLFLVSVAAISLFVAGIGIMNIMLVSVTERTREIGLRKALGATSRDILLQFLLEAITLTALGGAVGIFLGALFSFVASLALGSYIGLGWTFTFPWGATVIGFIVSASVGLLFGLYPARKASRKSPMEALRYE